MTAQPHSGPPGSGYRPASPEGAAWAAGGTTFAGVLLLLNGVLAMFQGIAAIVEDDVYARIGDYVYEVSLIGWGWILLVLGIVAAVVGWGILTGREWARATGIALASLSLVAQFLFLPYAPVWSVIMMAINLFVIWSLANAVPTAPPPE
ncbi:hypothetical protein G3I20_09880 [Streptomyces sp. SID8111]|uniref:DUF7144 family membrane protein n=1 Tax=Streptomyces sp. SID8111 TaxID=2706100 RepID=UPI0013BEB85F|nr:hypothetical protein [Streptomyces sp. SID8111]NEC26857.1 hypothetical protein [Streptomyces sp. SID8111]